MTGWSISYASRWTRPTVAERDRKPVELPNWQHNGIYLPSTASTALGIVAVGAPVVVFKSEISPANADRMPSKHWLKPHCCIRARLALPC